MQSRFKLLVGIAGGLFVGGLSSLPDLCARSASDALNQTPPTLTEDVRDKLNALFLEQPLSKIEAGAEVMDCETGNVLWGYAPEKALNPASNLKLLTTAASLDLLGPAFRFDTTFLRDGPIEDGVLKGNLYVRGSGDPEVVYESVWKIVKDLQALGLNRIEGDLVADDSAFDSERTIQSWTEDVLDGDTQAYNPPLSALSFNFNTVAILVRPGARLNAPVRVSLETPTSYIKVENEAVTGKPAAAFTLSFSRERGGAEEGAAQEVLTLTGKMPSSMESKRFYRTITDPPRFALALLRDMMDKEGLVVTGQNRAGVTPTEAVGLYTHYSSQLSVLLTHMNKLSSNFIAEHVLKALGAKSYGTPGSTEKGLKVLREWASRAGIGWESAMILNGSGLSLETRVSPHQLVSLLCHVHKDFQLRYDFVSTLPISGVDGTMRNRMKGTPAAGQVRAKTGSVRGVFGFSGFLQTAGGKLLAFSFLSNGLQTKAEVGRVKRLQDVWANLLVGSPEGALGEGYSGQTGVTLEPEREAASPSE